MIRTPESMSRARRWAALILLPEARDPNPPRWDAVGTVLSVLGMASLVWGIKEAAKTHWTGASAWVAIAVAIIAMTLFVRRCLNRPDPFLDVRLFRSKPFTAGTIAALASMFGMAALMLLIAQWLQVVQGYTPIVAGLALLPMAVGSAIIMGSTPVEKAGNAAAIEEAMYDLGNVLGIAVLGSLAAALYRSYLSIESFVADGLPAGFADAAAESLVGALGVAEASGQALLANRAVDAFNDSLLLTSLVGGLILPAGAVAVFMLVPRRFDIAGKH